MPKSGVMRLANSNEIVVIRVDGSSSVAGARNHYTVGSDSSSATQGSSLAIVAGKKRLPMMQ
jgi:hypothetical protein